MKRISEMVRPFLAIIFGALLLLFYLNWLGAAGAYLALGIIAMVLAAYYLFVGIVGSLVKLQDKAKNVLDTLSISLYLVFLFVYFLIMMIEAAKTNAERAQYNLDPIVGPNGWVIMIVSMVAALALALLFAGAKLTGNGALGRLASLFASIFVGVLVLNIAFNLNGDSVNLGSVDIVNLVIDVVFVYMLFIGLGGLNKIPEPKKEEEKPEEIEQQGE